MRNITLSAALLLLIIVGVACQDTPQPLAVDSAAPRAQLMGPEVVGNIPNDGQNHVGRIIVIVKGALGGPGGARVNSTTACGIVFDNYDVVSINPGGGPGFVTRVAIDQTENLNPGDRLEILSQMPCDGHLDIRLERITSGP